MLERVEFFNFLGNGDVHVSRTLVRKVMELVEAKEYVYKHKWNPSLLEDIPNLKHDNNNSGINDYSGWYLNNGVLTCNTWYNAYNCSVSVGIKITTLINVFRKGLKECLDIDLPESDYLPFIEYDNLSNIEPVKRFTKDLLETGKRLILISNSDSPGNGYMRHFDMNPLIQTLSDVYKNTIFIITNDEYPKIEADNVIYFKQIIDVPSDQNLISYVSTLCNVIIGRCTGPHTFCLVRDNFIDSNKSLFQAVWMEEYDFGVSEVLKEHCKFYWSLAEECDDLTKFVMEKL